MYILLSAVLHGVSAKKKRKPVRFTAYLRTLLYRMRKHTVKRKKIPGNARTMSVMI